MVVRVVVAFVMWGTGLAARSQPTDSLRAAAMADARSVYRQAVRAQSLINHGIEVGQLPKNIGGSPYLWEDFIEGNITYDGQAYANIPLQYDAVNEQVLTQHPFGFFEMALVQNQVTAFEVNGQFFQKLSLPGGASGFYQVLRSGQVTVLARRRKEMRERLSGNEVEKSYREIDQFYIQKEGRLYRMHSRKQLWALLGSKKTAIRKKWKQQGLSFGQQKEQALLVAAAMYE